MGFEDSKLRQLVGSQLLLVPGARIVIENADGKILLQKRSDLGVGGDFRAETPSRAKIWYRW